MDGGQRGITKGAPGGAVPKVASQKGEDGLERDNAGVVQSWDDQSARFSEPGRA